MLLAAAAATTLLASAAHAAWNIDPATGTGFVGKGDVQLVYGWNNRQLNTNAGSISFEYSSTTVTETTWTCDRDAGPQTSERSNRVRERTQGVLNSIVRDNKTLQITGFNLTGFNGAVTEKTVENGPDVGSCPNGWTAIDIVEGEPTTTGSGLYVRFNGGSPQPLPQL